MPAPHVIIGAGTMGSAIASTLAGRGEPVVAFDQREAPNTLAEHHGEARLFRTAYFEHPTYVPLLQRARELWMDLNIRARNIVGTDLYTETGVIYGSAPGGEVVAGSLASARVHNVPIEPLTPAHAARRFPSIHYPAGWDCAFEPHAGVIRPEATVAACIALARAAGATIHANRPVARLTLRDDHVIVHTGVEHAPSQDLVARHVVICAGAWTSRLLRDSGLQAPPIIATRQPLGWITPHHPERFALGVHPCWGAEDAPGSLAYGFPLLPSAQAFRVAHHQLGRQVDPDTFDRHAAPEDHTHLAATIARHLPDAGPLTRVAITHYSVSPDQHFLLGQIAPRVWLCSGFSGHGFKFAPVIGEVFADVLTTGRSRHDLSFFAPARLATG
jgi:sarcosine oxidase